MNTPASKFAESINKKCGVCGGRLNACNVLGHRPEADRHVLWHPDDLAERASTASAISEAQIDAYLTAQRKRIQEADHSWGRGVKCAAHLTPVRDACRSGLEAAFALAAPTAQPVGQAEGETPDVRTDSEIAFGVVQRVLDYDDRTSPEDYPEMLLITSGELYDEVIRALVDRRAAVEPSQPAPAAPDYETWLRRVCITAPPAAAYDLAKDAWVAGRASTPPAPAAPSEDKLRTSVLEEWATYERRGEICSFEGYPMIHASILEELAALAASTKGAAS